MPRSLKTKLIAAVKKWFGKWKAKRASVRFKRARICQLKRELKVAKKEMLKFEGLIASNRDELCQKSPETLGTGELEFLEEGDSQEVSFGSSDSDS